MDINNYVRLEDIIRKNLENRGMGGIKSRGELEGAAVSLIGGSTILVVTGFAIKSAMIGETDGPIGAVSLAGALEQLEKKVVIITDEHSERILHSCLAARGITSQIEVISMGSEEVFCHQLLSKYKPTHVIAIERPGRASDGRCYSMRGEDISDIVPNADILFEEAKRQGINTIAVGDGGNEIGMGKIRHYVMEALYNGKKICAAVSADYLILAGVSNWGGHALAAALSIVTKRMLLHDNETEAKMLESIVEAGAVDGCTKGKTMTVDGLSLEENLKVLDLLRITAADAIKRL